MLRIRVRHDDSSSGLVPPTIRPFQHLVDCVNVDPADRHLYSHLRRRLMNFVCDLRQS